MHWAYMKWVITVELKAYWKIAPIPKIQAVSVVLFNDATSKDAEPNTGGGLPSLVPPS